ncbi:hypothetical protein [Chromobacterium sp. ASV23]|uniref:hypothetical protein n=1 Tax=Chromobacterium sp. ASV23 TaxID=2795110 RepID=UPI0018EC5A14|nr:hypothetical protein [Chromobacterium sp. ASV23]
MNYREHIARARASLRLLATAEDYAQQEQFASLTAWFDYRFFSPDVRAVLLLAAYDDKARQFQHSHIDCATAYTPRHGSDPFGNEVFARGIHRLRLMVDCVGCPYDFAMRNLFDRASAIGISQMPIAAELGLGDAQDALREAWAGATLDRLYVPSNPTFKAENYTGTSLQDAYLTFAAYQIRKRPHPHMALASLMFRHKVLPQQFAMERFGPGMVMKAEEHYRKEA